MKNTAKLSLVALAFSLILAGCWGDDTDEKALKAKQDFETLTNYGIYANGQYTFKYTEEDYQIAFNESNNSVRLQKDDMTTYAIFSLDSAPSKGAMVQLTVQGKGVSTVKATQMEVVKTSSDGVWIWDKTSLTGYYIYWEF